MPSGAAQAKVKPADRVLTNGAIYTVDGPQTWARAIAVTGSRIVAVGSNRKVRAYEGPKTKVTDLKGRMVMPGLQDGHSHPIPGGESLSACGLDYESLTENQFRERIQSCLDASKEKEPDGWLDVGAWNAEQALPAGTVVTKEALEGLDTQRPILVQNSDGHKALVNDRGLELAGITDDTPNPPGGVIDRDSNGKATGLLFEGAQNLARDLIPSASFDDRVGFAKTALDAMNSEGITSALDANGGSEALKAYDALRKRGQLGLRLEVGTVLGTEESKQIPKVLKEQQKLKKKYKGLLNAGLIKIFADGVLEAPAQTAALIKPYFVEKNGKWVRGKSHGELQINQKDMNRLTTAFNRRGFQVHMHAIGDLGVRQSLDAMAASRKANRTKGWGNRNSITHLQLVDPKDYPRFRRLKVIPSMEFQWFQRDSYTVDAVKNFIGPERFKRMYPAKSLVKAGAKLAGGSDWPVDPLFPWYAIERAVSRTADSWYGYTGALNANQAISLGQALRSYTLNSAFQMKQDRTTGSLEKGKQADMIVLDRNLFRVPVDKVSETKVLTTMLGGKVVYDASIDK
ncbi:MAG: amidohydrolase [Solirubrobacterales bacterium]